MRASGAASFEVMLNPGGALEAEKMTVKVAVMVADLREHGALPSQLAAGQQPPGD